MWVCKMVSGKDHWGRKVAGPHGDHVLDNPDPPSHGEPAGAWLEKGSLCDCQTQCPFLHQVLKGPE